MEVADNEKQPAYNEMQPAYSRPPLVPQLHPWLVFCHGKHQQRQTFFSISKDRYYSRIIPDMCNKEILTCAYGWLVLEDNDTREFCLWNPISMEKVQLPPMKRPFEQYSCVLSAPPTDPDCHVIFVDRLSEYLMFFQPGDKEFVKYEFGLEDARIISTTTLEGKFYGLTLGEHHLLTIDFTGSTVAFRQLTREELPQPSRPEILYITDYLVECCGDLLFVRKEYLTIYAEVLGFIVFQLDWSKMVWVKLESLGNRAVFLDLYQGMSCFAAESGIRGNCIYYTEEQDRSLYVFDLEDGSISISLPCPIVSRRNSVLRWVKMPATNNLLDA